MADRISSDTDALRSAAGRCEWAAGDVRRILTSLVDGLGSLGDVTGDDEGGRAFATDHDAAKDRIEAALRNLIGCAEGMAEGFEAAADNLDCAERASTVRRAS